MLEVAKQLELMRGEMRKQRKLDEKRVKDEPKRHQDEHYSQAQMA